MTDTRINKLKERLGSTLQFQVNLFPYLTLRMGTVADYFIDAKSREELVRAVSTAAGLSVPYIVVGGGSNIASLKNTLNLLFIKNSYSFSKMVHETTDTVDVLVSSGYSMGRLVNETVEHGWGGLEYHKGLPGSVGGAIYMNSKWTRPVTYVGDLLVSATLLDDHGREKTVERDYFKFAYDYSILQKTKETVLDVTFRFNKTDPDLLKARAQESLQYRKRTQPFGVATAGCFFRNIEKSDQAEKGLPTASAGYLIDQAGMKGSKCGGYEVSSVHANFIINTDKEGQPGDLLQLVKEIKTKVKNKFGIELREEVVTL